MHILPPFKTSVLISQARFHVVTLLHPCTHAESLLQASEGPFQQDTDSSGALERMQRTYFLLIKTTLYFTKNLNKFISLELLFKKARILNRWKNN